jgi:hypothetical protein
VLLDLAAVEVTRTWLRGRAGDAVSETALEVLQAGREEGREAGTRHALAATLHKLFRLRFGGIPAAAAMRIEAAPTPELERWIEGVLTADSLDTLLV